MRCGRCLATYPAAAWVWRCACGGALDPADASAPLDVAALPGRVPDLWRYAEALPPLTARVSLGEPMTPLVPVQLGQRRVWLKCDYLMPTGSYKDRGSSVLISHLKGIGVTDAVEDSSGNAGASLAAYAAAAGMAMTVFCPASASPGKRAQIQLYGAALRPVDGPRRRTTEALQAHLAATPGVFYASHLWHPCFIEGLKTLAFEIAEQRGWRTPDAILCPVGAGSILLGLARGFAELHRTAVVARRPRLFAVQAAAVAPVARAWMGGLADVPPWDSPSPTLAEGIALPAPVRGPEILAALRDSRGGAVTVSEPDIGQGLLTLGRLGFCVEPTSAVVVKGLERLDQAGALRPDEEVVLILSGVGLKAGPTLERLLAGPA